MMLSADYVAGFFDGEGSIGIYKNSNGRGRTLRVQITQNVGTDSDLLLRGLADDWGASMCVMTGLRLRRAWNWQLSGVKAVAFLKWIEPCLVLKRSQAVVAIRWYEGKSIPQPNALGQRQKLPVAQVVRGQLAAFRLKQMKKGT